MNRAVCSVSVHTKSLPYCPCYTFRNTKRSLSAEVRIVVLELGVGVVVVAVAVVVVAVVVHPGRTIVRIHEKQKWS